MCFYLLQCVGLHLSCVVGIPSRDVMSPPSPVQVRACQLCNGHGWLGPNNSSGPLVVTASGIGNIGSSSASGSFSHGISGIISSSPPIRHSNKASTFARPAPRKEPSTPGDRYFTIQ